jgi:hypothetical protein
MLAKALQEGRVETQVFSAFDHAWMPQDKSALRTNPPPPSFTCQLDECSTSLDPKNLCKVVAGVNLEVRTSTDPNSESTMYTKYMYVCICGADWDSGPNHRYCRRRVHSAYGAFPEPGPGYGVGYFTPYGEYGGRYGYGPSFSGTPPPPSLFSPTNSLPPSKNTKQPRLIQFEYDDRFVPSPTNITTNNVYPMNSTTGASNTSPVSSSNPMKSSPSTFPSFDAVYDPLYPLPPSMPSDDASQPPSPSYDGPNSLSPTSSGLASIPLELDPSPSPKPFPNPFTNYPILIPGEDPYQSISVDDFPLNEDGYIVIPPSIEDEPASGDDHPRNRTTLASLIPFIEEGYIEEDETGYVTGVQVTKTSKPLKRNFTGRGPKASGTGGKSGGGRPRNETTGIPFAPTSTPVHLQPIQKPLAVPPSFYSLQSSDQTRLEYLEILVYSLSGALAAIIMCAVGYYCCRKRKFSLSPSKPTASDTHRDLDLIPIPLSRPSVSDLDPEFSRNSEALSSPLPDLSIADLDLVGRKACEDAWAKLGGLPGKGMSQVVIYYGTPYASVVRPGDSTQSQTEEYRSDVLVDVTLSPDEPLSTASSSLSHTRTKFRYALRRDANTSATVSRSESQSTNMSLVSNTACSSSASGTEY